MNPKTQAEKLLKSLYIDADEESLELVIKAIKKIEEDRDEEWREWLHKNVEETILANNTKCTGCGRNIKIERKTNTIHVHCK